MKRTNMNIFQQITNNILTDGLRRDINERNRIKKNDILDVYAYESFNKGALLESISSEEEESFNLKCELRKYFKREAKYLETIGDHPDFLYLRDTQDTENHHVVSVFVDIKGSTKLATIKGLSLQEVREIKNRILTTAISIFQVFDGHIHRLQGDAIFAFFGRKDKPMEESIVDALNAVTILQHVFKNVLSKLFEELELPTIDIRTGLDFGYDKDVLWSKYGIENCNEITTTSIHTDLAAKLQHKARSNQIMIGDNIKNVLELPNEFYRIKTYVENREKKEDKYILDYKEMRYRMWEFDWEEYLKFFQQLPTNNLLPAKYPWQPYKDFEVICRYETETGWKVYERNSTVLDKGIKLSFEVIFNDPSLKYLCKNIVWEVNNRGEEASVGENNTLVFKTPNKDGNVFECFQGTAYKGHHYMNVQIIGDGGRIYGEDNLGIFIK
ncbi:nucleotide-binding domain-containing protein [Cetobacterium sp.]|uniref:nucleotide-binding domain-containing protein n=1 Tax=Cetobacterium sp. TaxID=2071632 RepID=UPI003EE5570A